MAINLDELIENSIIKLFQNSEIRVVFPEKDYLEKICNNLLGKQITGYSIIENETSYVWENKKVTCKNYVASTIIPSEKLKDTVNYFIEQIKKKWKVPLIQVIPCLVNSSFNEYLYK